MFLSNSSFLFGGAFHYLKDVELKEISVTESFSTLIEIGLEKFVLVFAVQERRGMTLPSFFELPSLTDVNTAVVSVEDFVDPGRFGVALIVELHPTSLG